MLMRWPEDGVGKEVCLASEVDAELARLTAERDAAIARAERAERVAKRLTLVRQKIMEWHELIESEQDLDDSAGDGISVRDVLLKEMEDAAESPYALVEASEGGRE